MKVRDTYGIWILYQFITSAAWPTKEHNGETYLNAVGDLALGIQDL